MGISPQILAVAALGIAVATWGFYLVALAKNTLSGLPWGSIALMLVALIGGAYAIVGLSTAPVIAPAAVGITMSGLFLGLLSIRKTPIGAITVAVGGHILPFSAQSATGSQFDSASFAGQRVLLKFFRGSW